MRLQLRYLSSRLEKESPDWRLLEGSTITLRGGQTRQIASVDLGSRGTGVVFRILATGETDPIAGGYTVAAIESGLFLDVQLGDEQWHRLEEACGRAQERAESRKLETEREGKRRREEKEAKERAIREEEERRAAFHNRVEERQKVEERRRAAIAEVLQKTGLERLVHVTTLQNLPSILWWGLFPPDYYQLLPQSPMWNDTYGPRSRLGGTVFLYVAHPCDEQFRQWQENSNEDTVWVVLAISPSVLLERRCGFYVPKLAIAPQDDTEECESQEEGFLDADLVEPDHEVKVAKYQLHGSIRYTERYRRDEDVSFASVFADPQSEANNLDLSFKANEPRSPWTIACVQGVVSPRFITAIHVRDQVGQRKVQELLEHLSPPGPDLQVSPQLFERRPSAAQFFLDSCKGIENILDDDNGDSLGYDDTGGVPERLGRWEQVGRY